MAWTEQRQAYADQLEAFEYCCNAELVNLHPSILDAAYRGEAPDITYDSTGERINYQPAPLYAAVAQAAHLVTEQPGRRLAERPLTFALATGDIALDTLVTIVNASQTPVSGTHAVETAAIPFSIDKPFHACEEAEAYFAATIAALHDPTLYFSRPMGYWIVTDKGQPVGLRKGYAYPSMLSLREIVINGIPYPPGSLMRASLPEERTEDGYKVPKHSPDCGTVQLEELEQVSFVRLSAYAVDPQYRAGAFPEAAVFTEASVEHGHEVFKQWNLNQIEAAVRKSPYF